MDRIVRINVTKNERNVTLNVVNNVIKIIVSQNSSSGGGGGITTLTSSGGTITITGSPTAKNLELSPALLALINSALQDAPNNANAYVRSGLSWVIGYTKSAIDSLLNGKANNPTGTPDGTKYLRDDNTWQFLINATSAIKGIAKLYNSLGSNTDGSIDQLGITTAIKSAAPDNSFLNLVPSGWITTLNNYTSVVTNGTFSSTVSNSNNLTRFQPFVTNKVVNIDELYLSIQNNNTGASATATLYVFASDNDGLPGTKLHQEISATNIFNTPNSIITFGNNFTLEPGVYWIGIHIRDLNLASTNPSFYFASLGGDVKGIQSAAITFTNNYQGVLGVAATVTDLSDNPAVTITSSTALSVPMLKIKHQ